MKKTIIENKVDFLLQQIIFVFILIYCIIYANERIVFADSANYLFHIINTKSFFCPHSRYIACFAEYLPLIGVWLKLPISSLIILFSVNSIFTVYLIYLSIIYITKNVNYGWLIIMSQIVFVNISFFYVVPEHIGYAMVTAFYCIYDFSVLCQNKKTFALSLIILFISIAFGHSLLIIIAPILAMLGTIHRKQNKKYFLYVIGVILLAFVFHKLVLPSSGYDIDKTNQFFNNLKSNWKSLDKSVFKSFYNMYYKYTKYYNFLILYVLATSIFLLIKKKYKILITSVIFSILCFYINCIYIYTNWEMPCYMALYMNMFFIIWNIVFFISCENHKFKYIYFSILIIISAHNINSHLPYYKERYLYLNNILNKYETNESQKIIIYKKDLDWSKLNFEWTIPMETLLISSVHGNSKTIYPVDGSYDSVSINTFNSLLYTENDVNQNFNKDYFKIKSQPYKYFQ